MRRRRVYLLGRRRRGRRGTCGPLDRQREHAQYEIAGSAIDTPATPPVAPPPAPPLPPPPPIDLTKLALAGDHYEVDPTATTASASRSTRRYRPRPRSCSPRPRRRARAIVAMAPDGRVLALAGRRTERPDRQGRRDARPAARARCVGTGGVGVQAGHGERARHRGDGPRRQGELPRRRPLGARVEPPRRQARQQHREPGVRRRALEQRDPRQARVPAPRPRRADRSGAPARRRCWYRGGTARRHRRDRRQALDAARPRPVIRAHGGRVLVVGDLDRRDQAGVRRRQRRQARRDLGLAAVGGRRCDARGDVRRRRRSADAVPARRHGARRAPRTCSMPASPSRSRA